MLNLIKNGLIDRFVSQPPDIEEAVLTRPKMAPECLGAKSTALGTVPNLWNPVEAIAMAVKNRAK